MNFPHKLDAFDLQRLGLLLLAAAELSKDRYVLLRYSERMRTWRVSVRLLHPAECRCAAPLGCVGVGEHVATSQDSPILALDRAVQWLRSGHAQFGVYGPRPYSGRDVVPLNGA